MRAMCCLRSTRQRIRGPTTSFVMRLASSWWASAVRRLVSRASWRICCHPSEPVPPRERAEGAGSSGDRAAPAAVDDEDEGGSGMKRDASGNGVGIGVVPGAESFLRVRECELWASAMPAQRVCRAGQRERAGVKEEREERRLTLVKGGGALCDAFELVRAVDEDVGRLCPGGGGRRVGFEGRRGEGVGGRLWVAVRGGRGGPAVRAEAEHGRLGKRVDSAR